MAIRQYNSKRSRCAFSLVELVIVIVVIGIVAAIAVPRLTRGATQAGAAAMWADAAELNNAVELYRAEHGGLSPTTTHIAHQLTKFTNLAGNDARSAADPASGVIYGPYLRAIPKLKLGPNKGASVIASAPGPNVGWVYTGNGATIAPNLFDADMEISDEVVDQLNTTREKLDETIGRVISP